MPDKINQPEIRVIVEKVQKYLAAKDYNRATKLVRDRLEVFPDNKQLLQLLADIKNRYKEDRINELLQEAVILMQTGSQDEAQIRLREILKLDPNRTDLLDSLS